MTVNTEAVDPAILSREFDLSWSKLGRRTYRGGWRDKHFTGQELIEWLSEHRAVTNKDGRCFLQGHAAGKERNALAMDTLDLLILDLDTGESMDALIEKVKARGWFCLAYTTYSNLKSVTEVKKDIITKRLPNRDAEITADDVVAYLIEAKRYQPSVLEDAFILKEEQTPRGMEIFLQHKPMEKFRLVFFLKDQFQPAKRPGNKTHKEGMAEWKAYYVGVAKELGAFYDKSCTDPSRLFYTPAHAEDAPEGSWRFEVVPGTHLDLSQVTPATDADLRLGKAAVPVEPVESNAWTRAAAAMGGAGRGGKKDTTTAFLFEFVGKYARDFEYCDFMVDMFPDDDRGERSGGQPGRTFRCPNEDAHSNAGDEEDQGFFCVNATESINQGGFIAKCMHDGCADKDRVDFLDLACQAAGIENAYDLRKWVVESTEIPEKAKDDDTDQTIQNPVQAEVRQSDHKETVLGDVPPAETEKPSKNLNSPKSFATTQGAKNAIVALADDDDIASEAIALRIAASNFSEKAKEDLKKALIKKGGISATVYNKVVRKAEKAKVPLNTEDKLDEDAKSILLDWNKKYAVILLGGRVKVLKEPVEEGAAPDFMDKDAFVTWTANQKMMSVNKDGEPILVPVSKEWLEWDRRRQHSRVVFEPEWPPNPDIYNLWKGYPIKPRKGNWQLLRDHMRENVCNGNEEHFEWLMTWLSQMFQFPADKKGSSVVLRGLKGTGKSKVFDWVRKAMGQYASKISHRNHLVGNFNNHQFGKILVVAEEALWAGDKEASGVLKDMITSNTMMLEKKGIDSIEVSNYGRQAFISNEDWVVPAGLEDERRFLVLECGNGRRGQTEFFASVDEQMVNGGLEAMVYDFMTFKPKSKLGWNCLRQPPHTEALSQQSMHSLDISDRFFVQMIQDGGCFSQIEGDDTSFELELDERTFVPVEDIRKFFEASLHGLKQYMTNPAGLTKKVQNWLLADKTMHMMNVQNKSRRVLCYSIAPLSELREKFAFLMSPGGVKDDESPIDNHFTKSATKTLRKGA